MDGQITFSTAVQSDTVVALTAPPQRACPTRPPAGVQANPGYGFDAESALVLSDGASVEFALTPRRSDVSGRLTRLCAYLLRNGVVGARGSRRLDVSLAPPVRRSGHSAGSVVAGVVVVLTVVGMVAAVAWRLQRLPAPREPRPGGGAPQHARSVPAAGPFSRAGEFESSGDVRDEVAVVLARVGFSRHALERFAARAGIPLTGYDTIEMLVRDLLAREGKVTTQRPVWSRSSNTADLYLQAGEWMLFILRRDRWLPWRYYCVTAVNGPEGNTWETALRRGYIHTPPPQSPTG